MTSISRNNSLNSRTVISEENGLRTHCNTKLFKAKAKQGQKDLKALSSLRSKLSAASPEKIPLINSDIRELEEKTEGLSPRRSPHIKRALIAFQVIGILLAIAGLITAIIGLSSITLIGLNIGVVTLGSTLGIISTTGIALIAGGLGGVTVGSLIALGSSWLGKKNAQKNHEIDMKNAPHIMKNYIDLSNQETYSPIPIEEFSQTYKDLFSLTNQDVDDNKSKSLPSLSNSGPDQKEKDKSTDSPQRYGDI